MYTKCKWILCLTGSDLQVISFCICKYSKIWNTSCPQHLAKEINNLYQITCLLASNLLSFHIYYLLLTGPHSASNICMWLSLCWAPMMCGSSSQCQGWWSRETYLLTRKLVFSLPVPTKSMALLYLLHRVISSFTFTFEVLAHWQWVHVIGNIHMKSTDVLCEWDLWKVVDARKGGGLETSWT